MCNKMGSQPLNCPLSLCCNKTFSSKQLLLEHLTSVIENLYCPVCKNKWTSLDHLIAHLSQDNCQLDNTVHTIIFDPQGSNIENSTILNSDIKVFENEINTSNAASHFATEHTYGTPVDPNNENKMYVELFSKSSKPCLQTRELKLVKTMNGESRYMIVSQDDTELNPDSTIVTKQNTDGTISLTTVKEMKVETDALITTQNEPEPTPTEIYSCNSCKVSFSSLIDHIQNYHNDQDVVVEEPMEEGETEIFPERYPIEYGALVGEDPLVASDKQAPRRVITDTGDIVEEPLIFKADAVVQRDPISIDPLQVETVKVEDKQGRLFTRRYVQIDKMGDNVNKNGTPTEKVKYPCPHCSVVYENSKSLCAHMKAHKVRTDGMVEAADDPISYECGICCTVFPTNKSLKLHKRMHDPIKSRPIELPVENIDGSEVSDMRYRCHICDKMIPEDYKTIHQNSHKTSNKMNCGICNKKFTSLEYLEMHMNIHNMDKVPVNRQDQSLPYNCLYCNRRFARPHEKVKHERIHTGEKPHSCEICGKSFRVSYCLTLHMRTHTGARPYACPHCGKRFKAHSVYNHHLLTHSEVRAYKCPYCPKAFKTSVQLSGHKNSHTKPFSCQQCNRPFASLYAVRVHTETHSRQNNLKFCCELCGASYARAFALKDHIKQVHKQDGEASPTRIIGTDDDWMIKENTDADGMSLNKDLTQEITDLGMNSNELIVP